MCTYCQSYPKSHWNDRIKKYDYEWIHNNTSKLEWCRQWARIDRNSESYPVKCYQFEKETRENWGFCNLKVEIKELHDRVLRDFDAIKVIKFRGFCKWKTYFLFENVHYFSKKYAPYIQICFRSIVFVR